MVDYERALDDLGFRNAEEGASRRLGLARRRRFALGRRRRQWRWRRRRLGFRAGGVVCLGGEPCPSFYRWRGRPRGGESLPNSAWRWAGDGGEELLPNSVSTSLS